jgi:hypothetical protein
MRQIEGFRGGLNTDVTGRKRDKGMTALYESRISLQAAAITLESCSRTFSPMAR